MDYYLSAKMDSDKMTIGLENLERECALLENYVSLLDAQEAAVIRLYYFERKNGKMSRKHWIFRSKQLSSGETPLYCGFARCLNIGNR